MATSIGARPQRRSQRSTFDLWPCPPFNHMPQLSKSNSLGWTPQPKAADLSPTSDVRRQGQVSLVQVMQPHKNPTLGVGEGRASCDGTHNLVRAKFRPCAAGRSDAWLGRPKPDL